MVFFPFCSGSLAFTDAAVPDGVAAVSAADAARVAAAGLLRSTPQNDHERHRLHQKLQRIAVGTRRTSSTGNRDSDDQDFDVV